MKTWYTGLNNWTKHTLIESQDGFNTYEYYVELTDHEIPNNRSVNEMFMDHLADREISMIEVSLSGGLDSEICLRSCLENKLPVRALTVDLRVKGISFNIADLYYSEKFCRENQVEHRVIPLDIETLYDNGDHLQYLLPYNIIQPHLAAQMWLLEQATGYVVIGGDWPWLQTHKPERCLSPWRYDLNAVELFMRDRGIPGINNMISHSLESTATFISQHYQMYQQYDFGSSIYYSIVPFKYDMYKNLGITCHPKRVKSYGWELLDYDKAFYDLDPIRMDLIKRLGNTTTSISWGNVIAQAANMLPGTNNKFT